MKFRNQIPVAQTTRSVEDPRSRIQPPSCESSLNRVASPFLDYKLLPGSSRWLLIVWTLDSAESRCSLGVPWCKWHPEYFYHLSVSSRTLSPPVCAAWTSIFFLTMSIGATSPGEGILSGFPWWRVATQNIRGWTAGLDVTLLPTIQEAGRLGRLLLLLFYYINIRHQS